MFPSTAVILDERYKRKDSSYPVKLRVTYNRKQVYYPLNINLTKEDWEKTQLPTARSSFKQHKLLFNKVEQRAVEIIRNLPAFSFSSFEKVFTDQSDNKQKDVFTYFENYVKSLEAEGRIGTAESYRNALNSFKKFISDKRRTTFPFELIDAEFLNKYEEWMVNKGSSLTTVGIYSRSLRTILNLAIEKGDMLKENYPFTKRKYQIPAGSNVKKALRKEDIKKLVEYIPKTETELWARDMWLLSYLANGANIKDLSLLKIKNLSPTSIQFIRAKTERSTKQDLKPVVVMRIQKINEILTKWGKLTGHPDEFVFDILDGTLTLKEARSKIKQATKTINKYMERIRTALGIEMELTTYTARHSFATILKRSGASTDFISESLGHKDKKTTENYLDSFEDETKFAFQNALLQF